MVKEAEVEKYYSLRDYPRTSDGKCKFDFFVNENFAFMTDEEKLEYRRRVIVPKNDRVFKRLLGQKGDEEGLKDFLESILGINIKSLEFNQNTELMGNNDDEKDSRIDVCAELDGGTLVDIEMQAEPSGYSEERCLAYWSRVYSSTIKKAADYTSAKKTICIWLIDGTVYPKVNNYQIEWKIKPDSEQDCDYFDKLEIYTIELNKFRKSSIISPKKKEFWLWFIDHTNKEMIQMGCTKYQEIRKLQDKLDELTAEPGVEHELINIEFGRRDKIAALNRARSEGMEQGLAEGREKGLAEGKAEGRAEGRREGRREGEIESKEVIARKLLKMKMPIEQISEATGLSIEEIVRLKVRQ